MTQNRENKVIYIAGYGRSGSTILDIMLGNHPKITSAGEVTLLLEDWDDAKRFCACGEPYTACPFWASFVAEYGLNKAEAHQLRKVEKSNALWRLLSRMTHPKTLAQYIQYQVALFDHIRKESCKPIVVDSSKSARFTAGRFWALQRHANQEVYLIHLVRDGWSTMQSLLLTGRNWVIEGYQEKPNGMAAIRFSIGWIRANLTATLLGRLCHRNRYLKVNHETLLSNPQQLIDEIGAFIELDMTPVKEQVQANTPLHITHMVGGNRVRQQQTIHLNRSVSTRNNRQLPWHSRLVFLIIGGWLNRLYGNRWSWHNS